MTPAAPRAPMQASASHIGASSRDTALADWLPLPASADADLLPDLGTLMARSRDLARNNGLMAGGMQTLRDNIVGATLRLSTMPDYRLLGWSRERAREWGNDVEAQFRSWAETTECDAGRTLNLLGQTLLHLSGAMLNGDAVALPMWLPRPGQRWNTRLMLIESDRLATPPALRYSDKVRGGIEFDPYGAPVAYYILKRHPGDAWAGFGLGGHAAEYDRVPAFTAWGRRRVLHLHDKERSGQSRGKPVVAGVLREFKMVGDYASNELKASVANSLVAAFLESDLGQESAAALFGDQPGAAWADSVKEAGVLRDRRRLEGAAVIPLPVGARLSSFTPSRPNQAFEAFMLASLRNIAAGMNLPYELLLKDFSRTNYSSARASLLEAWRYFQGRRRWLRDYWLNEVYALWLEEAVNAGAVDAPGFYAQRYAYCRARFIFGGRGWVDPVKEAQATILRLNAGLTTLEKEAAEQGEDYEELLDQLATEQQMRADRGLPPAGGSAQNPSGLAQSEAPADPADDAGSDAEEEQEIAA